MRHLRGFFYMKQFRALYSLVIYSNIHVGFIALGWVWSTQVLLGIHSNYWLNVAAFCLSWAVYLGDRLGKKAPEDAINQPEREAWIATRQQVLKVVCALLVCVGLFATAHLKWSVWEFGFGLAFISLFYLRSKRLINFRLKTITPLKWFVLIAAWVGCGVVLPLIQSRHVFDLSTMLYILYRSCLILANVSLSDMWDWEGDAPIMIVTIKEKSMGWVAKISLGIGIVIGIWAYFVWNPCFGLDVMGYIGLLVMVMRNPQATLQNRLIADLWVGFPLVTAIVALFLNF